MAPHRHRSGARRAPESFREMLPVEPPPTHGWLLTANIVNEYFTAISYGEDSLYSALRNFCRYHRIDTREMNYVEACTYPAFVFYSANVDMAFILYMEPTRCFACIHDTIDTIWIQAELCPVATDMDTDANSTQ